MIKYLASRIRSFRPAFHGLWVLFKEEPNARIHLVALAVVIALGFILKLSPVEWVITSLSIGLVLGMEAMNSAMENLSDFVSPEYHSRIKKVKDLSAGGVLVSALAALTTGIVIFLPKLIALC